MVYCLANKEFFMTKIDLIWVVVSNLNKAIAHYTDVLGFVLKEKHDEFGWAELAGKEGGTRLGLAAASNENLLKAGQNAVIAVSVKDLAKTKENFKKKGVNLIGEIQEVPGVVKLQTFADQDGNLFQLAQNLR